MATEYKVLRAVDGSPGGWSSINIVTASNDRQAIKLATEGRDADDRTGTFVAVPTRSFRPRTRGVDIVEKDVWS